MAKKKIQVQRGGLSRQLDIPEEKNIPLKLTDKIANTKIGKTIKNPTSIGSKRIKVTKLVKKRAIIVTAAKKIRALGK